MTDAPDPQPDLPPDLRSDPPLDADERATLLGFLDYHRQTLRQKTAGLDAAQLAATHAPSEITLGGMLKHLAFVEHWWFRCVFLGEEYAEPWASVDWRADADWDWHSAVDDTPEQLRAILDEAVADSDTIVAGATDLGALSQRAGRAGDRFSLRWILVHMVEEYARHNGHADLLREALDGTTGE
ncbi:DinB family protein [Nocardioides sp. KIGAM211]|uniref:DinB family protein n=1 Tax=Nocardioides luti TaxID=2761101 RepID=A0A7X0REX3_9ACTN|nr:DinB family protein [Nocardioides luti]MBB6627021.1 DinB family protein [Nocardioides luti]